MVIMSNSELVHVEGWMTSEKNIRKDFIALDNYLEMESISHWDIFPRTIWSRRNPLKSFAGLTVSATAFVDVCVEIHCNSLI